MSQNTNPEAPRIPKPSTLKPPSAAGVPSIEDVLKADLAQKKLAERIQKITALAGKNTIFLEELLKSEIKTLEKARIGSDHTPALEEIENIKLALTFQKDNAWLQKTEPGKMFSFQEVQAKRTVALNKLDAAMQAEMVATPGKGASAFVPVPDDQARAMPLEEFSRRTREVENRTASLKPKSPQQPGQQPVVGTRTPPPLTSRGEARGTQAAPQLSAELQTEMKRVAEKILADLNEGNAQAAAEELEQFTEKFKTQIPPAAVANNLKYVEKLAQTSPDEARKMGGSETGQAAVAKVSGQIVKDAQKDSKATADDAAKAVSDALKAGDGKAAAAALREFNNNGALSAQTRQANELAAKNFEALSQQQSKTAGAMTGSGNIAGVTKVVNMGASLQASKEKGGRGFSTAATTDGRHYENGVAVPGPGHVGGGKPAGQCQDGGRS